MVLNSKYVAGPMDTQILHASVMRIFVMSLRGSRRLCFLGLFSEDELAEICVFWYPLQHFCLRFIVLLKLMDVLTL